jgi:hypothetical protein
MPEASPVGGRWVCAPRWSWQGSTAAPVAAGRLTVAGRLGPASAAPHATMVAMKTRNLMILAALTGLAIIAAFTTQVLTDGRFLG